MPSPVLGTLPVSTNRGESIRPDEPADEVDDVTGEDAVRLMGSEPTVVELVGEVSDALERSMSRVCYTQYLPSISRP